MKPFALSILIASCSVPILMSCGRESGIKTQPSSYANKLSIPAAPSDKSNSVTSWAIDTAASQVKFEIKNLGIAVNGTFGGLKGTILFDPKDLRNSKFETAVEVETINTGISKRDEDLLSSRYLSQKQFTQIAFRSDSIRPIVNGYEVFGILTLKGKSQHRSLLFTFSEEGNNGIFKSHFTINRLDFGIGSKMSIMGDEARITLEVLARKNKDKSL